VKRASVGRAELLLLSGSVGVVLLAVVMAEIGLRWLDPRRLDRREAGQQVYSEWYGWENRRGFQGLLHDALTTVDSSGRRSPGRVTTESERRPRVVMLGDSITFGSAVRDEETFCALMTPRYDVVNLGVEGYGTDQELLKLEREGLAYHPDVVVLNFTARERHLECPDTLRRRDGPSETLLHPGGRVPGTPSRASAALAAGSCGAVDLRLFGAL
jgi:hypothetical protein